MRELSVVRCLGAAERWMQVPLWGDQPGGSLLCADRGGGAGQGKSGLKQLRAFYSSQILLGCQTCTFKCVSPIILSGLSYKATFRKVKEILRLKHLSPSPHGFGAHWRSWGAVLRWIFVVSPLNT